VGVSTNYPTVQDFGNIYVIDGVINSDSTSGDGIVSRNFVASTGSSLQVSALTGKAISAQESISITGTDSKLKGVEGLHSETGYVNLLDKTTTEIGAKNFGIFAKGNVKLDGKADLTVTALTGDEVKDAAKPDAAQTAEDDEDAPKPADTHETADSKFLAGIYAGNDLDVSLSGSAKAVLNGVVDKDKDGKKFGGAALADGNITLATLTAVKPGAVGDLTDWGAKKAVVEGDSAAAVATFEAITLSSLDVLMASPWFWVVLGILVLLIIGLILLFVFRAKRALIILDVQRDFITGGALPVAGADEISKNIVAYVNQHKKKFKKLYAVREWHQSPGSHFSSWPVHAMADTPGAQFTADFEPLVVDLGMDVVSKGQFEDGYSAFSGVLLDGSKIEESLKAAKISKVTIVGFATDYSVLATALDAEKLWPKKKNRVAVLKALTAAVAPEDLDKVQLKFEKHNIDFA
jgi:nicotinamidase/pyrazinamidase